jgi:hypothetical protein
VTEYKHGRKFNEESEDFNWSASSKGFSDDRWKVMRALAWKIYLRFQRGEFVAEWMIKTVEKNERWSI